jgi:hypothetical protein
VPERQVIWRGALPREELSGPKNGFRRHALDCSWILAVEEKHSLRLPRVPLDSIPQKVRPCRRCGGG